MQIVNWPSTSAAGIFNIVMQQEKMVTLRDCFNNDSEGIGAETKFKLSWKNKEDKSFHFEVEITFKVSMPWVSDRVLYFIYIPSNSHAADVCNRVMHEYKDYRKTMGILEGKRGHMFGGDIKMGLDEPVFKPL